jgi:hypothetical protein
MIVHNLNVLRTFRHPPKAHAELVIDANAVLSSAIAFERFQSIPRRDAEIIKPARTVQHGQLAHRDCFDIDEALDSCTIKQALRVRTLEGLDCHDGY